MSKQTAEYWVTQMAEWLFCTKKEYLEYLYFEKKEQELHDILVQLLEEEQITTDKAAEIANTFFETISKIHKMLLKDLKAVLEFDPAAKSTNEVLVTYPGFFAITVHRIAHELWNKNVTILARLIAELAHGKTGIDIHPGATIGERFFIDHGTGIVIGETAHIGKDVKIYQGVTLGALTVSRAVAEKKRHPTIEDGVVIYANATILGGETIIGKESIIGGNVWITASIPSHSLVFHKSEIVVKNKKPFPEALNFSI